MALSEAPSSGFSGALQEHRTTLSFAFLDAAAGFYYVCLEPSAHLHHISLSCCGTRK